MQKIDWCLLKKSVLKEAAPDEEEEVEAWKQQSVEHRKFYRKLAVFLNRTEKEGVDVEGNYRKFLRQREKDVRRRFIRWTAYVAVAACLLIGLGYIIFGLKQPVSRMGEEIIPIVAGTSKAVLYPGMGEPIILENETQKEILSHKNFSLNQKNNQVRYVIADSAYLSSEVHTLAVPHGGEFQLCLSDATEVYINSESELKYPAVFTGEERRVVLSGEAYFQVSKSAVPFIIEVNGMEIKVLGTEFNVRAYRDEANYQTTLVQGKVEVTAAGQKVYLRPGDQAVLRGKNILTKHQVDVSKYVAWKDGSVAFEDERLEDIMRKLAKWYNIEVFYMQPALKDIRFTGNIDRYRDIRILLEKIEKLEVVRFEVKGNCITIVSK